MLDMSLGSSEPTDKQRKIKKRMEKHASKQIEEVSEGSHALEDAEKVLENKLEAEEFEKAGRVFREIRNLKRNCEDDNFSEEAEKWSEIVEKFQHRAEEILEKKMNECKKEIAEAEEIEDKVHNNMANHEAAEGVTNNPVQDEFNAIKRDLEESEQDIEALSTISIKFNLENVKEDIIDVKTEWKKAKANLQKLSS